MSARTNQKAVVEPVLTSQQQNTSPSHQQHSSTTSSAKLPLDFNLLKSCSKLGITQSEEPCIHMVSIALFLHENVDSAAFLLHFCTGLANVTWSFCGRSRPSPSVATALMFYALSLSKQKHQENKPPVNSTVAPAFFLSSLKF